MNIHCIGITGKGMAPLAEFMARAGHVVTGSDTNPKHTRAYLEELGITIMTEHSADNVAGADLVIASSGIPTDNPEIVTAKDKLIPMPSRLELLRKLIVNKGQKIVAVSGSFGKTTTTTILAQIFLTARLDPSYYIGGYVHQFKGSARFGQGPYCAVEADEYKSEFFKLDVAANLTTNIEENHLDYFKTNDTLIDTFARFYAVNDLKPETNVVCIDSPFIEFMLEKHAIKATTYGLNNGDWQLKNLDLTDDGLMSFEVYHHNEHYFSTTMQVPGQQIALNSLGCIALAHGLGINKALIKQGLEDFAGVSRRFEKVVDALNLKAIDDNARLPLQVAATIDAARLAYPNYKLMVVCGFWGRLNKRNLTGFSEVLSNADSLFILALGACSSVHGGAEDEDADIRLARLVQEKNPTSHTYLERNEDFKQVLADCTQNGQRFVIMTIGYDDYLPRFRAIWADIEGSLDV